MKYAKPCYSSKKLNESDDFASFCLFLVFWSNSHRGRLLGRGSIRQGAFFFFYRGASNVISDDRETWERISQKLIF